MMAQAALSLSPVAVPIFRPYSSVARIVAHRLARRVIERQLQAQGLLVAHVSYAHISALARSYLAAHQELLDQATERVRRDPTLRAMAEREERERQRQWRKSRVLDRAVLS